VPLTYVVGVDNIGSGKGSSSWVRRYSKSPQATGPCAHGLWCFEPKINRLRYTVED